MRTTERRMSRELTQETTLEAAERLAGIDGIASLSLKRLADEAGVSTMVIYSRFGDRYGLEEALLHRATDSLTDVVGATGSPGDVSVENCCVAIREWAHSNPARFSMLFLTSHLLDTGLHDMARQSARAAAKVVATQVGWQDDDDSRAMSLIAALVGFLGFELRGELPGNTAEAFTRLARSLASLHTTSHR